MNFTNLLISTIGSLIVFFIAIAALNRHMDKKGEPKTFGRRVRVFFMAWAISWASAFALDWVFPFNPDIDALLGVSGGSMGLTPGQTQMIPGLAPAGK